MQARNVVHQPHDTLRDAETRGDIVAAFHNILSVCFVFSLPEWVIHSLYHSDEGLLRKETAEHSSAFEASQTRVTTQITTDLEHKNHNCEGCGHAVRLLSG
jgi:hypothetical protein